MSPSVALLLRVDAPICAFRPFSSREYQDTYPVPTPASVYGMLLSFLGVDRKDKVQYAGVKMALAVSPSRDGARTVDEALPWRSSVFRKLRRVSQYGYNQIKRQGSAAAKQFVLSQRRPDYQDLLTDVVLWVWLSVEDDSQKSSLPRALSAALADPSSMPPRHGGLSLGESSYLVNRINAIRPEGVPQQVIALRPSIDGFYSLPIWTDHVHDRSRLERFELILASPHPPNWFIVAP
jgi:CRISPR-associated protein Cas5t